VCGICGIAGLNDKEIAEKAISQMNASLAHRGPDDEGSFIDNTIALGHRRLSIIDLSKNGHQPMFSCDGRFTIVYNGELYNFKNLRLELQRSKVGDTAAAYSFRTQSDTEVILAAYQRWGADCLKYFNGMFALAIWDKQKEELFIARDRLGIKPLYYWQTPKSINGDNGVIIFASETRALLKSNLVPKKLGKSAVYEYVKFQTVHAPATILENVKMLLPGHYLLIHKSEFNNPVIQRKYWSLSERNSSGQDITKPSPAKPYEEICKDVKELFFASVERRLVADVPFGAFLSGGIDSSLVVAVMSKLMKEKVRTFSVSFDELEYNEAPYAAQIARQYNTQHYDIKLSPRECLFKLPEALASMDHPSGDGINTYIVSEATKKAGITMALSGLGGDELFAGYPLFKRLYKLEKIKWVSGFPFVSLPFKVMNMLRQSPANAKLLEMAGLPNWGIENIYPLTREIFTKKEMEKLFDAPQTSRNDFGTGSKGALNSAAQSPFRGLGFNPNHEILSKISIAELSYYLPDILLRDTDQMAMAHALEVRVPFLDYTLVEYVLGLPDDVKYPSTPKKLLTDAMKGLLPESITNRKKMGFTFPWDNWMRNDLKPFCEEKINSLSHREYFNKDNLQYLWKGFLKEKPECPWYKIWHLVVLENWINVNKIDG
jgi:asparagine synthase (glutamine-hydrolysing)